MTQLLTSIAADVEHVLTTPGFHKRADFCEAVRAKLDRLTLLGRIKRTWVEIEFNGRVVMVEAYESRGTL